MKKFKVIKYIGLTLGIALSIFAVNSVIHANWTAPLHSPPSCPSGEPGCDTPVHVGTSTQIKSGSFGVGGVFQANTETHLAVAGGNVGIGTTAPGAKLDVRGNVQIPNADTTLSFGSDTRQMINLWATNYGIGIQNGTLYFRTGSDFAFYRGGSHNDANLSPGTGGIVDMVINNGNVGIGTTAPGAKLHVAGNIITHDPVAANHVATKGWVEALLAGGI